MIAAAAKHRHEDNENIKKTIVVIVPPDHGTSSSKSSEKEESICALRCLSTSFIRVSFRLLEHHCVEKKILPGILLSHSPFSSSY
mmetsp:Transcript_12578/g.36639  ORF Transcript_12578/g.36639 Transcript_12578/m.36639 type:complete len:85 (-) Transcript_12578:646-900(-)